MGKQPQLVLGVLGSFKHLGLAFLRSEHNQNHINHLKNLVSDVIRLRITR
jgi:hypothetical protein